MTAAKCCKSCPEFRARRGKLTCIILNREVELCEPCAVITEALFSLDGYGDDGYSNDEEFGFIVNS